MFLFFPLFSFSFLYENSNFNEPLPSLRDRSSNSYNVQVKNCQFIGCTLSKPPDIESDDSSWGGAIYACKVSKNDAFLFEFSSFMQCNCYYRGGAIALNIKSLNSSPEVIINKCIFSSNFVQCTSPSQTSGSAIIIYNAPNGVEISSTNFSSNYGAHNVLELGSNNMVTNIQFSFFSQNQLSGDGAMDIENIFNEMVPTTTFQLSSCCFLQTSPTTATSIRVSPNSNTYTQMAVIINMNSFDVAKEQAIIVDSHIPSYLQN